MLVLVGVVGLSFGAAQSELAAGIAARFDAEVLEEAQNARGTHFILLGPLGDPVVPIVVQNVVMDAVAERAAGSVVVVYPKVRNIHLGGTHEAAVGVKRATGDVVGRSVDWANDARRDDALDVSALEFSFGSTTLLADLEYFERERYVYRPRSSASSSSSSAPRNVCVSSSSASGSSMTCYSDRRVSYRSSCTSSGGRISCRSESY